MKLKKDLRIFKENDLEKELEQAAKTEFKV